MLLHAWYPGQEGGNALAKILFGDVDPSAKLPVTFEANISDNPAFESYPSDESSEQAKTSIMTKEYSSDTEATNGLGSSLCSLSALGSRTLDSSTQTCESNRATRRIPDNVKVSFEIRNTGDRAGAEVAQLYVSCRRNRRWQGLSESSRGLPKSFCCRANQSKPPFRLTEDPLRTLTRGQVNGEQIPEGT